MLKIYSSLLILFFFLSSCDKKGIGDVKTYSKNDNIHAVVEIPSGTAKIYEYDYKEKGFKNKIENKVERKFDFLPLPFNFGFIPSTQMLSHPNKNKALEVVVLSEEYSIGTLLEIEILGALEYNYNNKKNILILSNPIYEDAKLINVNNSSELIENYSDVIEIVKKYFQNNYKYKFSDVLIDNVETKKIIHNQIIERN